ncbi:MAG TPA: glycosyl hydrolase family 28 protein [Verrucomicrobiae bacterium]
MRHLLLLSILTVFASSLYANPVLPVIPARTTNVTSSPFNAVSGVATNTTAIQSAINAIAKLGGGTVEIPSGTFLSGPLNFSNNINLQLDSGAILRMLPYGSYPGTAAFITATTLTNIEFSGAGAIDGQADFIGWWGHGLGTSSRPVLLSFSKCNIVLIQNISLSNPPSMHITFKNATGNVTIQGITINTSGSSPNTDGIDLIGTNCLVQNSAISAGDDNIAFGSTGGTTSGVLVTNCSFGSGHGLSIGSNTSGGVSNITAVACSFNGTQYGIRMKSDNNTVAGGEGGITQNLTYENLMMANILIGAIVIYSYYSEVGTPLDISPATAAGEAAPVPNSTTAIWRNIVISNLTATVANGGEAGIIWARTEMPLTNIVFSHVNITAPTTFDVYNAYGMQFVDSQVTVPSGTNTFTIYNAGITISNDTPTAGVSTIDGLTSLNSLALYNASASTMATDIFAANPVTVAAGTLAIDNDFTAPAGETYNFTIGANASTISATGNLTFNNSTINITNAAGFGVGSYTLFTYSGTLGGTYALGTTPANFNYALDTSISGQLNLNVTSIGPSLSPVSVVSQVVGNQLELSWPTDHIGWELEAQTNAAGTGVSNDWYVVTGSSTTNTVFFPVDPSNGSAFLRLFYNP